MARIYEAYLQLSVIMLMDAIYNSATTNSLLSPIMCFMNEQVYLYLAACLSKQIKYTSMHYEMYSPKTDLSSCVIYDV